MILNTLYYECRHILALLATLLLPVIAYAQAPSTLDKGEEAAAYSGAIGPGPGFNHEMRESRMPANDDTTSDLTYYLPIQCPGHTERILLPFYNLTHSDSAAQITFTGEEASSYTLDTILPFALPPTEMVRFAVYYRWTTPGRHVTMMTIHTTSGIRHRVKLVAITDRAYMPMLDVRAVHLGEHGESFDTCFIVTNTYYTHITFSDTAWLPHGGGYRLLTPLPLYIPPGKAAKICVRVNNLRSGDSALLTLGGTILDTFHIGRCVAHRMVLDARPPSPLLSVEEERHAFGIACSPNPAGDLLRVEFTAASRGDVIVRLIGLKGAEAIVMHRNGTEAGRHTLHLNTSGVPEGIYALRLEQGEERESRMVAIVR